MTKPEDPQQEADELELDVEVVRDLEVEEVDAELVAGGSTNISQRCSGI
jgi:hypothetical protein